MLVDLELLPVILTQLLLVVSQDMDSIQVILHVSNANLELNLVNPPLLLPNVSLDSPYLMENVLVQLDKVQLLMEPLVELVHLTVVLVLLLVNVLLVNLLHSP
jgi:hypothetical protein